MNVCDVCVRMLYGQQIVIYGQIYFICRQNRRPNQIIKRAQRYSELCADRKTSTYQGIVKSTSKTKQNFAPMTNDDAVTFDPARHRIQFNFELK